MPKKKRKFTGVTDAVMFLRYFFNRRQWFKSPINRANMVADANEEEYIAFRTLQRISVDTYRRITK